MATQYAKFNTRSADLTTEFGLEMAIKWFGQEEVDKLPKFIKGKNKGKPKGMYVWTKVDAGGWVRDRYHPDGGYVEHRRGAIIERKLCHRESSQHGVFAGDTIIKLDQGESVESRKADRIKNDLEYWSHSIAEHEYKLKKKIEQIEALRSDKIEEDKREFAESVAQDFEKDVEALQIVIASARDAYGKIEGKTEEIIEAAIAKVDDDIEFVKRVGINTALDQEDLDILESQKEVLKNT